MTVKSKTIVLVVTLTLVLSVIMPSFAQSEPVPELTNGEELVDEVTEEIIEEGDFTEETQENIEEEVNLLFDEDFPVEDIVEVLKMETL